MQSTWILIAIVLIVFTPLVYGRTEWIDPHSLDEDPRIACDCPSGPTQQASSSAITSYYIRTLNLILKPLVYHNEVHSAHYQVALTKEDHAFIKSFLDRLQHGADGSSQDLDRVDKLLTQIFVNHEDTYLYQLLTWKDYLFVKVTTREFGVALGCIFLFWFLYKLKHTKFRFWSMLKYFMFILYVVDYVYTWIYMLKEKELQQLLHVTYTVPPECNVKRMGYLNYFGYLLDSFKGTDRCAEYHKIKDIDIFWSVSPSQVFGMQVGNLIVGPAEKIGNAFSKIISGVFKEASWFMMIPTVIMMPFLLFGLIIIGCVLLSFVTGRGFSFNLMHLIQFSFGGGTGDRNERVRQPQMPTINFTLPQLAVKGGGGGSGGQRRRIKGEKKTPIAAIEETKKVEVEDVPEDDNEESGDESDEIVVLQRDDHQHSEKHVEEEYEVIS